MPTATTQQILPPKNWDEFESLCADLWTRIWNDPDTQKNGRQGQSQYGIDIVGRPNEGQGYAGVQCKGKDVYNQKKVTKKDLETEVEKAKAFRPRLKKFILATTAPNDETIQEIARTLTIEHQKIGLFSVHVYSWDEIQRRLADHSDIYSKHYPESGSRAQLTLQIVTDIQHRGATKEDLDAGLSKLAAKIENQRVPTLFASDDVDSKDPIDQALNAEIDGYRELLNENRLNLALNQLENMKDRVWENASDHIKFRVMTNIGACQSRLGQFAVAEQSFMNAASFNPSDEKALCNVAFGYLLTHQYEQAYTAAECAIERYPNSARAYALLVSAIDISSPIQDPTTLVPIEHQNVAEVAYSISHFYRVRNQFDNDLQWVEKALALDKDSIEIRASAGAAYFQTVLNDPSLVFGGQLASDLPRIEQAKSLLTGVWQDLKDTDLAKEFLHVAINLANLERLSGHLPKSLAIVESVLQIDQTCHDALVLKAIIELQSKQFEAVLATSKQLDQSHYPKMMAMRAEALYRLGRYNEALTVVDSISESGASEIIEAVGSLRLDIIEKSNGIEAAIEAAETFKNMHPDNVRIHCELYRLYQESHAPEEAQQIFNDMKSLITTETDFRVRHLWADLLFSQTLYDDALPVYEGLVNAYDDSQALRKLLQCLLQTDQRKRLLSIIKQLPPHTKNNLFYIRLRCATYLRVGLLNEALRCADKLIKQDPEDLNARLTWIDISEKLGNVNQIRQFLKHDSPFNKASPEDRVILSNYLIKYSFEYQALALAYNNRRSHYGNLYVHQGYISLFLVANNKIRDILNVSSIGADTAFTLINAENNATTYIIESNDPLNLQAGEIHITDHIATVSLSKHVSDAVIVSSEQHHKDIRHVTMVMHKYLYAYHDSLNRINELFPSDKSLTKIDLVESDDPQQRFSPIFETITKRHEYISQIESLYSEKSLPLSIIAKMTHTHPIDVWRSYMVSPDRVIKVCIGANEEMLIAESLIKSNRKGYIVDPITLVTIHTLNVGEKLFLGSEMLGITQSSLDLIQQLIDERVVRKEGYLSLSKVGDQIVKHEITKEDIARDITFLESVISWASSNCEIVPSVGSSDLPHELVTFGEMLMPAFYDTLLAAQGSNRLLISNDQHFRQFSKMVKNVNSVWLQPILLDAVAKERIGNREYADCIEYLVCTNHSYVTVNEEVLINLAEKYDWYISNAFEQVADILRNNRSSLSSSVNVAGKFLVRLWGLPISLTKKERITFHILDILTRSRCNDLVDIVQYLLEVGKLIYPGLGIVDRTLNNALLFVDAVKGWCQGHFIRIDIVVDRGT